jgi:hypothetical protein
MLKIKNNNGTRDENSSAQHVIKKINYKTSTCAGNVQSQHFLPTQFPHPHHIISYHINALLASQMPKLSTLAYQEKTV